MKKLIGTAMLAALLATSAFAEISLGGWGRGLWSVFGYDGDAKMTHGISWGSNVPRVGITVAGDSDNIGFVFSLNADGGSIGAMDVAYVWAKPWDWLKVSIGEIQDDTLRVNAGFGQFNWLRVGFGLTGEDITFRRIGAFGGFGAGSSFQGAEIALTPVEGLYIAAAFKAASGDPANTPIVTDFADVLKQSQYAVGYKIDDILAIKAQYIGGNSTVDNYFGWINAAVDLLMIEDNFISIGAYIPTDFDESIDIAAVWHGGFDALSLNALVKAGINDNFDLGIGVGVGYDIGNGLGIEADVRTSLVFPDGGDTYGDVTIGAFLSKGFSNGIFGIGAEVAIPFGEKWSDADNKIVNNTASIATLGASDKVSVAIPIKVEYWF